MYTLRFDGLFKSVPGFRKTACKAGLMGYGWLIYRNGNIIASGHGVIARGKEATSLNAEYLALIEGLEAMLDLGIQGEPIRIMGDAKCVIEQMQGAASVNSKGMKPFHKRASQMVQHFRHIEWAWTPRKFNYDADKLTRRAMQQLLLDIEHYREAIKAIDPRHKGPKDKFLSLVDLRVYNPAKSSF